MAGYKPGMVMALAIGISACGGGGGSPDTNTDNNNNLTNVSLVAKTGQSLCYNTAGDEINCLLAFNQDGSQQAGVTWPVPRFNLNSDNTITDALTGLDWAPDANLMTVRDLNWDNDAIKNDGKVSWQHALDYIAKLNAEQYQGHNDWRLPNRNELMSLGHYGENNLASWLNTQGFSQVLASPYWSSTSWNSLPSSAWVVNLLDGYLLRLSKTDITLYSYVWPVRDGIVSDPPVRLAQTGQTSCYDAAGTPSVCANTGQDGELQKGLVWPTSRFTNNTDSSRSDNLTTLIWAPHGNLLMNRDAGFDSDGGIDGHVSWQNALNYISKLNTEQYLGHSDWRMSNIRELQSLQHGGASSWLSGEGFQSVQANYWTSTSRKATPDFAWVFNLLNGIPADDKTTNYAVWPVRGGT